jgi:hypothetical protein
MTRLYSFLARCPPLALAFSVEVIERPTYNIIADDMSFRTHPDDRFRSFHQWSKVIVFQELFRWDEYSISSISSRFGFIGPADNILPGKTLDPVSANEKVSVHDLPRSKSYARFGRVHGHNTTIDADIAMWLSSRVQHPVEISSLF